MLIQVSLWGMRDSLRNLIFLTELCRCNEMNLKSYRSWSNKDAVGISCKQLLFLP